MGPAKWAVLWQWACSSLSAEDIRPEMEQCLVDLKQLEEKLSHDMQFVEGKTSFQLDAYFDRKQFLGILRHDFWYRDVLNRRSDLGSAVLDLSRKI